MSILNVEHLSHGFGDRAIFEDVSFRLLRGEHIGLIGANGEGKSTFMSIVTGKLQPDEGRVEWSKNVRAGYLDQHAVLEPGMTVGDVLRSAFAWLLEKTGCAADCQPLLRRMKYERATIAELTCLLEHLDVPLPATSPEGCRFLQKFHRLLFPAQRAQRSLPLCSA